MLRPAPVLLAGLAALSLSLFAFVPAASAAPTLLCGADVDFWSADYTCRVNGVGPSGTVVWCPDPLFCANGDVLSCYVDLSPPWFCQLL
jgi:hypothetical protein